MFSTKKTFKWCQKLKCLCRILLVQLDSPNVRFADLTSNNVVCIHITSLLLCPSYDGCHNGRKDLYQQVKLFQILRSCETSRIQHVNGIQHDEMCSKLCWKQMWGFWFLWWEVWAVWERYATEWPSHSTTWCRRSSTYMWVSSCVYTCINPITRQYKFSLD